VPLEANLGRFFGPISCGQEASSVASRGRETAAFSEHDDVWAKPSNGQMFAVLHCCIAVGRVRNDSGTEFSYKRISFEKRISLPPLPSAVLRAFGTRHEMRMRGDSHAGCDAARESVVGRYAAVQSFSSVRNEGSRWIGAPRWSRSRPAASSHCVPKPNVSATAT
jgi:hypothetical protein